MKKFGLILALVAALPVSALVSVSAVAAAEPEGLVKVAVGKMLYDADGKKLAAIYKLDSKGPQLLLDGKVVTVPAATLTEVDGKFATSMTKRDLMTR
ncbi:hypothetical protein [Caulobacter sp. LARHSG274]